MGLTLNNSIGIFCELLKKIMITDFGKIFIFILVAVFFVAIAILFSKLIRPARPTKEKLMTYECGENALGSPWVKFNIRFYVIALIFLIFDVEVVLLFPWALTYKQYGFAGFVVGIIFLLVLGLGMAYEWRKGDLEWERPVINPPTLDKIAQSNIETKIIVETVELADNQS
jgi:NADH-quinone oxidoreductase subunit A